MAYALGFDLVGIRDVSTSAHIDGYRAWLDEGYHGEMAYLAREESVSRREELVRTLPTARSAIVVAESYLTSSPGEEGIDRSRGIIARYARGRDYHKVVKKRLQRLLDAVRNAAKEPVEGRAYVDTGPILERESARLAGLGWFGKNTMLIHPRKGSYLFLGLLLLDLDLEPDAEFVEDRCGTCRACIDACPTGALLGRTPDGAPVMDARRCISYLTIELRGPIPVELREAIGNRIYGCDICQEVCPWNNDRFAFPTEEPDYRPEWRSGPDRPEVPADLPGTESPSLVDLMRMTRDEWERWTRGSAIRRAGYEGFKRNVAVAMGNWLATLDASPDEAVAALTAAVEEGDPIVAEHAEWALARAARA